MKKIVLLLLITFICHTANSQLTIGIESGLTLPIMTNLNTLYDIRQNRTYDVSNLSDINGNIVLGYRLFKKFQVGFKFGILTTGFREMAVTYTTHELGAAEYVGYDASYKGYLADFTIDTKYDYLNYNFNIGYHISDKLNIILGFSKLQRLDDFNATTRRFQNMLAIDPSELINGITKVRFYNDEQLYDKFNLFRDYKNDVAITIDINYKVYRGLYLQLGYLRGFDKMNLVSYVTSDINNQAFKFNIGYQFTFKKNSKY